ncbi:hypothetical protein LAD12857_12820 [Lacrimispora amygdalina]|uniref:Uncharacterized protein n=1 Tax=Lacrimispora amygdalina TaxID=253257 RepID=A0ABQ5M414_9FIRM
MAHSTGLADRFNRPMINMFDTPDYAREKLNAEMGIILKNVIWELSLMKWNS